MKALEKDDSVARVVLGVTDEVAQVAHPLASWLLEKVRRVLACIVLSARFGPVFVYFVLLVY